MPLTSLYLFAGFARTKYPKPSDDVLSHSVSQLSGASRTLESQYSHLQCLQHVGVFLCRRETVLTIQNSLPVLLQLPHHCKSPRERPTPAGEERFHLSHMSLPIRPGSALLRADLHEAEAERRYLGRGAI